MATRKVPSRTLITHMIHTLNGGRVRGSHYALGGTGITPHTPSMESVLLSVCGPTVALVGSPLCVRVTN